jgi:hypothetical protein
MHSCWKESDAGCKPTLELYVFFFRFFHQVKPTSHALAQAVDAGEGGLGAESLPRAS